MRSPLRALAAPFGWLNRKLPWLFAPFRLITLPFRWLWGRWRALVVFFTEVPEDVSLTDTLGEALESRDTLKETLAGIGEHLDVLRRQLFRALLALVLATGLSLNFADRLMALLAAPLGDEAQTRLLSLAQRLGGDFQAVLAAPPGGEQFDVIRRASTEILNQLLQLGADGMTRLQVIEPTESIGVFMRVSLLVGIALAMPWLVLELYLFIAPGLMPRSRQLLGAPEGRGAVLSADRAGACEGLVRPGRDCSKISMGPPAPRARAPACGRSARCHRRSWSRWRTRAARGRVPDNPARGRIRPESARHAIARAQVRRA